MLQTHHLKLPVIAAPMFLVSGPELVIASCRSGIIGTFPALNQRSSAGLDDWLSEIESALVGVSQPGYGVNLIAHRSNPRLQADLEICVHHRVPLIITSLGAVPELVEAVHAYGGLVFHDVINLRHAKKAASAGVDGLIAVAAGAGGHAGTTSPFALLAEIRQFFDKTIVLSGSLSNGAEIAAAMTLGADYAYMGTRFICTQESRASEGHKEMIEAASAADIVYTDKVSGVHANFLQASIERFEAQTEEQNSASNDALDFGKELSAVEDEAKAWKDIWSAGQGVGSVRDTPTVEALVDTLRKEFHEAIEHVKKIPHRYK